MFFNKKKESEKTEEKPKEPADKNNTPKEQESAAEKASEKEPKFVDSSDSDGELSKEDIKKVKALFAEQETEIEAMKK